MKNVLKGVDSYIDVSTLILMGNTATASITCGNCRQTHDSVVAVRACYQGNTGPKLGGLDIPKTSRYTLVGSDEFEAGLRADALDEIAHTVKATRSYRDGTYTMVKPDGDYRTFQVRTQKDDAKFAPGETLLSFLAGPDNEASFNTCAFVKGNRVNVWRKFKANSSLMDDIESFMNCDLGNAHEMFKDRAEAFALASDRCMACGKTLTVPTSLHRGLGPVCFEKEAW